MSLILVKGQRVENEKLDSSRIVPPNTKISSLSVFSDPIWHMNSLVKTPGIKNSSKSWDFRNIPGFPIGFALSLAEYAYARLYKPVITHLKEGGWLTVHNELTVLNEFAQYCKQQGLKGFDEVDKSLCEKYLKILQFSDKDNLKKIKSEQRIRKIISLIYRFWEYRSVISFPLPSQPFDMSIEKLLKINKGTHNAGVNATSVIPEQIYTALIAAALDYVLIYSKTILSTWGAFKEQWRDFAHLSLSVKVAFRIKSKIFKQIAVINCANWRITNWTLFSDLYAELQQLRSACTIVILAFSGIRVSELLSLEAGCCVTNEYEKGQYRYYINTILHKHRGNGSRDTWVVIEEVVKAIKILEILTEKARTESQDNRLMLTDGSNSFFNINRSFIGVETKEFTSDAIIHQIQKFQDFCHGKLNRPKIIEWTNEKGQTQPWKFNTRQFRQTLARQIARQPFGIIAGMIQYKHVHVNIFEGYAGSEPEWNKILEHEKTLASIDFLSEVAMDMSNGQLAGDFGIKLKEEFTAEFRGRAEDYSPSQIAKWLASSQKKLFVGKFNFCFFDPTKALCTKKNITVNKPILNFCDPEECSNACIGKRHAPVWEAQLKQAEEIVAHPKISEFQRTVLQNQVKKLRIVVTNLGSENDEQ